MTSSSSPLKRPLPRSTTPDSSPPPPSKRLTRHSSSSSTFHGVVIPVKLTRAGTTSTCSPCSSTTPTSTPPRKQLSAVTNATRLSRSSTPSAKENRPIKRLDKMQLDGDSSEEEPTGVSELQADSATELDAPSLASSTSSTTNITPKKRSTTPVGSPPPLPSPPRAIPSIFTHAQSLLSTSSSSLASLPLLGRDEQRNTLVTFLLNRFPEVYHDDDVEEQDASSPSSTSRPSLYVSGPPGIGKTALLSSVLRDFSTKIAAHELEDEVKVHMENCSTLGGGGATVWERLGHGLGIDMRLGSGKGKMTGKQAFEKGLNGGGKFLIILDEVDHIHSYSTQSTSRDLLNALFALAHAPNSSLTLIGIANALDLTTRSLRLSGSPLSSPTKKNATTESSNEPQLLHFKASSAPEIELIIRQRLSLLVDSYPHIPSSTSATPSTTTATLPLFAAPALKLLSLKIAARTGDLRLAFEVLRHALTSLESTLPPSPPLSSYTPSSAPLITLPLISLSLRHSGLGVPPALSSLLSELTLNARLVLLSICLALSRTSAAGFETRAFDKCVRVGESFECYKEAVKSEGTLERRSMGMGEWRDALSLVEGAGLVGVGVGSGKASPAKKGKGKGGKEASDPEIALVKGGHGLDQLVEALCVVPASSCTADESTTSSGKAKEGAMQETLRICKRMIESEEKRIVDRRRKEREEKGKGRFKGGRDEEAPREGFGGFGLKEEPNGKGGKGAQKGKWLGGKRKAVEMEEDDEEVEGRKEVDLDSEDEA